MLRKALLTYLVYLTTMAMAMATPKVIERSTPQASPCMDEGSRNKLASRYADLISAFTTAKAEAVLIPDFTEISDSANLIAGKPPGTPTYSSREEFVEAQQRGQPSVAMEVVFIIADTCDSVVMGWTQDFDGVRVGGVSVLAAVMDDDDWRVASVVMEFNSAAYIRGHGGVCNGTE
ncbi:hypothetical protein F5Y09DRAFT_322443 [Xylaria sp. FL1042]|nr:hypothetical protein F5Y09DRAFT_322443 [Xylaria sp. FL1042]